MTFNYEVYRDFCGMYNDYDINKVTTLEDRNKALVAAFPKAVSKYCEAENVSKLDIIGIITSDDEESYVDYRTGINIKNVDYTEVPRVYAKLRFCYGFKPDEITKVRETCRSYTITGSKHGKVGDIL